MSKLCNFKSFYVNRPKPVFLKPDTKIKFVDQSEADRASLKYQLERFGMDSLLQQFEKTKSQFGYADTRLCKDFAELNQKMAEANSYFMELPSKIRAKFHHNATEFFSSIESNPEKMFKDGYISKSLAQNLGVKFDNDIDINVSSNDINVSSNDINVSSNDTNKTEAQDNQSNNT